MKFTLDTNILIGLGQRYPRDIFPTVWDRLEDTVAAGESCVGEAILHELRRGGDDLHGWARALPRFVCAASRGEFAIVAEIGRAHPGWVRGDRNGADPFLIAHARLDQRTTVTEERRAGRGVSDRNQKIPNIAAEHGVPTVTFFDFLRVHNWRF